MRIHNRAGWSVNIEHPLLPQLAPVSLSPHVSYGPPRCTIDGLAATVQQAQRYYDQGRTMSSVMNMRYTYHFYGCDLIISGMEITAEEARAISEGAQDDPAGLVFSPHDVLLGRKNLRYRLAVVPWQPQSMLEYDS